MHITDIQIRDPFVLPVASEGLYYLFGTTDTNCWGGPGTGFDTYLSRDLRDWEGPFPAFRPPAGFWATENFWAPEVHRYRDFYYLFASFKAPDRPRGTQILIADSPHGPFRPHSDGPVTPAAWEALDGTLHVDDAGQPWMVFCHEWVQVGDGEMCALPLTHDLTAPVGDPVLLFHASDAPWVQTFDGKAVTDGPFLHRMPDGELLMLWASTGAAGYTQGVARSTTGRVTGPWTHDPAPLYAQDGGHGMLFRTFQGQLTLTLHTPNATPHERAIFLPVKEDGGRLVVM